MTSLYYTKSGNVISARTLMPELGSFMLRVLSQVRRDDYHPDFRVDLPDVFQCVEAVVLGT